MLLNHQHITKIDGTVSLCASKSASNRLLIISKLGDFSADFENLSDCDDTQIIQHALSTESSKIDVDNCGTAMRFLTAYFAMQAGRTVTLDGNARMRQRPIAPLVDALRQLGADITYLGNEGFPPLAICGQKLQHTALTPHFEASSQYFSALMLIAPYIDGGLTLHLKNNITSQPYIELTAEMMKTFGAKIELTAEEIEIESGNYRSQKIAIENDWTAASYWYELLAIAPKGELILPNLWQNSNQGDKIVGKLFEQFGIKTFFNEKFVKIERIKREKTDWFEFDFVNNPDLAQTMAVTCCATNTKFSFTGVETLKIKESDRIETLISELKKCGFVLIYNELGKLTWNGATCERAEIPQINTHGDHRIAMAFAPLSLLMPIEIDNENVVKKSYPKFFEELERIMIS